MSPILWVPNLPFLVSTEEAETVAKAIFNEALFPTRWQYQSQV
jgi:hypothetical protein